MSFASSSLQNSYKPDRRVLDAVNALATRVDALEAEKVILRAENAELLSRLESLELWAKTLVYTKMVTSGG